MRFEDLDRLLESLDEKEIMERYYGEPIIEKKAIYRNPTRNDHKGTCSFCRKGTRFYLKDFGTGDTVGCYDLVMHLYNCTYYQARLKVANDFGLANLSVAELESKKKSVVESIVESKSSKSYLYTTRDYNQSDIDYWKQFHVTIETLVYCNIQPVNDIHSYDYASNRYFKKFDYKRKQELCYVFDINQKTKFYRPTSMLKEYKWFGNTDAECVYGIDKLSEYQSDTLIIASGPKDRAVLKQAGYDCIAPMSESTPLPEHVVEYAKKRFKRVYYLFDTDLAGLKNGVKYAILHGFKAIWIPKEPNVKDVADYAKKHGLNKLKELIQQLTNGNSKTYPRADCSTTSELRPSYENAAW